MATSRQIRRIATNPADYVRFATSGRLPRLIRPSSPLIDLLRALNPRDLAAIRGLTVGPDLGYAGNRTFPTGAQALRWLAPQEEMLEGDPWPAESWRAKAFTGPLALEDVLAHASSYPADLPRHYPGLRRRAPPASRVGGSERGGGGEQGPDESDLPPQRP